MTRTDYDSWGKPFPPELNLFVRKGHRTLKTGLAGPAGGPGPAAGVEPPVGVQAPS